MSEIDLYGVQCKKGHPAYPLWRDGERSPQKWADAYACHQHEVSLSEWMMYAMSCAYDEGVSDAK